MWRLRAWALAYLILLMLPFGIAIAISGTDPRPFRDEWASALAMIAFAALLLEFLLLGRLRPVSASLGSDLVMQSHQLLARTATVFLLAHPFLYSLWDRPTLPHDTGHAESLRLTGGDWSLSTGLLALGLLLLLVLSAITRSRNTSTDYDRWRLWHGALALTVLGLGLHHTLVAGRHSQSLEVAASWWLLFSVSLLTWMVVYVWRPMIQIRRAYQVAQISKRADRIWELVLHPRGGHHLKFHPGQFVWLKTGHVTPWKDHPFSICSAPLPSGELRFLIKEAGDYTQQLPKLPVGTLAYLDGPYGQMHIPKNAEAVILIAGGIGIAPLASLLAGCVQAGDTRPIRLVYADRNTAQKVSVAALCSTETLADFHEIRMVEEPSAEWVGLTGRLDATGLQQVLAHETVKPLLDKACFLVCGPAPMMDSVENGLTHHGIALGRIQAEKFQYDFGGSSPRTRRIRDTWLALSAAMVLAAAAGAAWLSWGG